MITSCRRALTTHAAVESFREHAHRPTPISSRVSSTRREDCRPRMAMIRHIRGRIHMGIYHENHRIEALLDALAADLGLAGGEPTRQVG